jgi:hypothetical protein
VPVDIGSNIGKTLPEFPPFETWPFAVAQTSNAAPGSLMPTGARLTFDVNLDDPFTVGYLQRSLQQGRLDFMVSSLHQVSGQFGSEPYPTFTTRFNQAILNPPTTMDLEVSIVRDLDSEPDGLPDDWEMFYFGDLDEFAGSDPDGDGASNLVEYESGTEPTQAASVFQIAAVRRNTAGEAVLQWPNLPSRNFVVEFGDAFSNWQTVANPPLIFHSPAIAEWTDTSGTNGTHFYRVRAIAD